MRNLACGLGSDRVVAEDLEWSLPWTRPRERAAPRDTNFLIFNYYRKCRSKNDIMLLFELKESFTKISDSGFELGLILVKT